MVPWLDSDAAWPPAEAELPNSAGGDRLQVVQWRELMNQALGKWYDAYAVAAPAGEPSEIVVTDWLTRLCDVALHLDGYEKSI